MKLIASAASHPGRARRNNEDAFSMGDGLYAVADGMGGHDDGALAAQLTCATVESGWQAAHRVGLKQRIARAIHAANTTVLDASVGKTGVGKMGSTVVALAIEGGEGTVAWAGDSRCGRLRDGSFAWITRDHSLQGEENEHAAKEGRSPRILRGIHAHVVTRTVGRPNLEPEIVDVDVRPGDTYLLCSDGLWSEYENRWPDRPLEVIGEDLQRRSERGWIAEKIVQVAVECGGRDNVTALVVHVEG